MEQPLDHRRHQEYWVMPSINAVADACMRAAGADLGLSAGVLRFHLPLRELITDTEMLVSIRYRHDPGEELQHSCESSRRGRHE